MATQTFVQTVEKPIAGLEIKMKIHNSSTANKDVALFNTEARFRTWIKDEFSDSITVSVSQKDKNGKETWPFSSFNLDALLEHAQASEGYIPIVYDGSNWFLQAYLPLTKTGAIQFSNDETMTITISYDDAQYNGCETEMIESPVASPTWTKYERMPIRQGDKDKDFKVLGNEVMMIPLESILENTKITLFYTNGMNMTLNKERLECIGRQINDVCYNVNGIVVGGFGRYAIIDVTLVDKVELRRDTDDAFQIILQTQESVGDLVTVQRMNGRLKDSTTPFIDAKIITAAKSAAQTR